MAYFAKVIEGQVVDLIVAETDVLATGILGNPDNFIEYRKDGSIRANPAMRGGHYDKEHDVFYSRQPYESWTLDSQWQWQPPVALPDDRTKGYRWSETAYKKDNSTGWVEVVEND